MIQLSDILTPVIVLLTSTSLCLAWLYLSSQSTTLRSLRTSVLIVARLTAVILPCYVILCTWLGMPNKVFAVGATMVLLLSLIATIDGPSADPSMAGLALAYAVWLPVYVLKQFVLGFPDHDKIILSAPSNTTLQDDLSRRLQSSGTVVATLRPCGTIEIDGSIYSAASADGKYLDAGTKIRVSGARNTLLVVMAADVID
jgi:membrane-bound ClpP family serine protease